MGHLDTIELPDRDTRDSSATEPAKNRWWLWIVVLGLVAVAFWYYRAAHSTSEAGAKGAQGSYGKGVPGGFCMFGPVSVVVATAQKGDLPVYLIGLGSVAAFNTVTVRSRVDGQIVKVNFTEGQFVHEGDALIEI